MSGIQKLGCLLVVLAGLWGCADGGGSGDGGAASAVPSPSASAPAEDPVLTQAFLGMVGNLYQSYGKPDYDEKMSRIQSNISDKRVNISAKQSGTGETALTLALERSPELVPLLLQGGSDVNGAGRDGVLPLGMAASRQDYPLFREMLQRGADPLADDMLLVSALSPFRGGEYHSADAEQIVRSLLKAGADPNKSGESGQTPLTLAARFGQAGIVRTLLENGADPNRLDGDGYSPLMCAVSPWIVDVEQLGEMVKLLVEAQTDVNAPSPEGKPPLQLLMELETVPKSDFGPIIRYLQDRGAKTDLTGPVVIVPAPQELPAPVIP